MQGYKMPTFGFHWSLSSMFPENSILMLEWLWNNLSVLFFFNIQFAMAVNYLHIWPRQTFMMIALPNQVENKLMIWGYSISDNPSDDSLTVPNNTPYYTFNSLSLFWLAESSWWILKSAPGTSSSSYRLYNNHVEDIQGLE